MDNTVISWIIAAIGFVLDAAVIAAVTVIVTKHIEKRYQERDAKEEQRRKDAAELARLQKEQEQRSMEMLMNKRCEIQTSAIREEFGKVNQQMTAELQDIHDQLSDISAGTLCSLRDDILNSYWRCHDWQKYRTEWDTSNMEALYDRYHQMHGNSFVDHLMEEFYKIPLQ